jgi:surface protein
MYKLTLLFLSFFISSSLFASDFITRWDLSIPGSNPNSLTFGVATTGTVNYTWETIPAGTTGSGTFSGTTATIASLPAGAMIRLSIDTNNCKQFRMNNGADKDRLLDVENWGTASWTSMNYAFQGCQNLNITAIDIPDLSLVTDMNSMFNVCTNLNGPSNINTWNTSNVTNMGYMFYQAYSFNQAIGIWNTNNVTDMNGMFFYAYSFNQAIGTWNTSSVINM